jgi:predicted nucleotide-binding protein
VESSNGQPPYPENAEAALFASDQLLAILEPLQGPSKTTDSERPAPINRIAPESRTVFIVHGHDEPNLFRLRTLLKERYLLNPTILMEEASSGQTVIEKFERMASEAAFCIVLMTPDGQVSLPTGGVAQAPMPYSNSAGFTGGLAAPGYVTWLSAELPHSDLAGIVSIEFIEKVDETVPASEKELRQAGLIS